MVPTYSPLGPQASGSTIAPPLLDLMTIGASVISAQQVDASPGPGPPVTPDRGFWTCCVALGGPLNAPPTDFQCHARRMADTQSPSSALTGSRTIVRRPREGRGSTIPPFGRRINQGHPRVPRPPACRLKGSARQINVSVPRAVRGRCRTPPLTMAKSPELARGWANSSSRALDGIPGTGVTPDTRRSGPRK